MKMAFISITILTRPDYFMSYNVFVVSIINLQQLIFIFILLCEY